MTYLHFLKTLIPYNPNTICNLFFLFQGDSGGPLVCRKPKDQNDKGYGVLVGLVCGGYHKVSIYSKVSPYSDFIQNVATVLQGYRPLLFVNVILVGLFLTWCKF